MQTAMGKTLELGWSLGECPIVMSVLSAYDNMKYPRIGVRVSPNKVSGTGVSGNLKCSICGCGGVFLRS